MKKVLSTIAILTAATVAFGQGYLNWNSTTTPIVQTNTSISALFGGSGAGGVSGSTMTVASSYYYALLISPQTTFGVAGTDTSVWDTTWTASGLTSTNSSTLTGRVIAGSSAIAVGGVENSASQAWNGNQSGGGGTTNNVVLVGWSSNLGSSWTVVEPILAALAVNNTGLLSAQIGSGTAYFGESMIGYLVPNSNSPGAGIFGTTVGGVNGTQIDNPAANPIELYALPVPEPATMALAGLGGLALLLIRRRN